MLYKTLVLSDVLRCVLYNIVCPCWVWPWYCLTFFVVFCITLFVHVGFGHGIVWRSSMWPWSKPTRTNNVIRNTSKNVRKYHDQSQQGQAMLYKTHRRMLDNTIAKTNTLFVLVGFGHGIVWRSSICFVLHYFSLTFWPCYCLTFFDVFCLTLFLLVGFDHSIVWRSSMCFVYPTRTNNVIQNTSNNVRQYHGQNQQGQTM
jgi:hypothetical protein